MVAVDIEDAVGVLEVFRAAAIGIITIGHGVDDGHWRDFQFICKRSSKAKATDCCESETLDDQHDCLPLRYKVTKHDSHSPRHDKHLGWRPGAARLFIRKTVYSIRNLSCSRLSHALEWHD
jgi:hypothetical protein